MIELVMKVCDASKNVEVCVADEGALEVATSCQQKVSVLPTEGPSSLNGMAERIIEMLEKYQEQPHLLDRHLNAIVTPLLSAARDKTPTEVSHRLFRLLYVITKVIVCAHILVDIPSRKRMVV